MADRSNQPSTLLATGRRVCGALAPLLLAAGCVSNNVIAPPVALVATESANVDRLEQGRTLYLQRCSRCHAAPIIRTLTPDEWDYWLPDMLTDSALKGPPAEAVTAYVAAVLQAPAVVFAPPPRD